MKLRFTNMLRGVLQRNKQLDASFWGGCPLCGGNDGYCSTGRVQWCFCHRHAVRWCRGENLVNSWRTESPAEQQERFARIEAYRLAQPIYAARDESAPSKGVPAHVTSALWTVLEYVWDAKTHSLRCDSHCPATVPEAFRTLKAWLELVDGPPR